MATLIVAPLGKEAEGVGIMESKIGTDGSYKMGDVAEITNMLSRLGGGINTHTN
jgi:hypothetical protein